MNTADLQESWKEQGADAYDVVARRRVAHPQVTLLRSIRRQTSSDGARVPLVGGVWAEVKGRAVGAVECHTEKEGNGEQIVTTKLILIRQAIRVML
jgi:hypothetical protein